MSPPTPADRRTHRTPMHVEPYRNCQNCGRALETTTHYRHHAYCGDCGGAMAVR